MKFILNKNLARRRGFTLVEIVLVLAVLGLLGTIALTTFFDSTKSFTFFANFKNMMSTMRQARSFAMTNTSTGGIVPDRYGVFFEEDDKLYKIFLFADTEEPPYVYKSPDILIQNKNYTIPKDKFRMEISAKTEFSNDPTLLKMPFTMYYEIGTGDFTGFYSTSQNPNATEKIPKRSDNFISIKLTDTNGGIVRYLLVNQVSGLTEEYLSLK